MKKSVFLLLVPAMLVFVVGAGAEEQQYKRWKLDFERGKLDYVTVEDAAGNSIPNWYLTYKVTNNTDGEVPLRLAIVAKTDTKKTYTDSLAPMAKILLERKTRKKYKSSIEMFTGSLPAGESVEAVAFFGDMDPNWDHLTIHVAGLLDTVEQVEGELFYENKVLVLKYNRPGDEFASNDDEIFFKGEEWVIEGERRKIPQRKIR